MSEISSSDAVWLGIVEGLTEFIPVSSTGHLILTSYLMGLEGDAVDSFEIFIQLGAILAVVFLYLPRFTGLLRLGGGNDETAVTASGFHGRAGILKLAAACAPLFVLGAIFGPSIKYYLFNAQTVAFALIVGGVAMWWVEGRGHTIRVKKVEQLTVRDAFMVGLCQCAALWPGMSRSASTIVGGMLLGLDRRVAAEFSFLVAVPVMCAATGAEILGNLHVLTPDHVAPFLIGFAVSFIVAVFAVRGFISVLGRVSLRPFAVYRILLGVVVLVTL